MSVRNLKALLRPTSVAVIGATTKPHMPGAVVMRNLLQAGFGGPIMTVTADSGSVAGVLAYPDVERLPVAPDLAVVCSDAATVPGVIRALAEKGTRAACVMTPALSRTVMADGRNALEAAKDEAKKGGMRMLGPNSLGIIVPSIGLNASMAPDNALPGKIAFVSQSAALCTAVLDWASVKGIGFSHFIHIGESADVGFGDLLDYLGGDPYTRAILLYVESIDAKRGFMSAARAAARNKPVLMIKAGRSAEQVGEASFHTGALAVSDLVFDAAIRRAGMLRVRDIDEIFGAVETLAHARPIKGRRLGIVTNGGGIGIIAADDLCDGGGELAKLSGDLLGRLDTLLPPYWSRTNPVDMGGDADPDRYVKTLTELLDSKEVDAVLVMHSPTAITESSAIAEAIIKVFKERTRANIMTCWVGNQKVAQARRLFAEAGVPSFDTPRAAVEGYLHVLEYRHNQDMLMQVPPSAPVDFAPDPRLAKGLVQAAINRGETVLPEPAAKAMLEAYGIPTIAVRIAHSPAEASRLAGEIMGPVVLKILSHDIPHKSDVGGVVLNLTSPFEVEKAAHAMLERVHAINPNAKIDGFTVQSMAVRKPGTQELIIGVTTDPIFGPVILVGQGGVEVEVIADLAVGLPPLNMSLAAELVGRTRVSKLLKGYRGRPPANLEALHLTLTQISQMIIDIPELIELDINPLLCDPDGVIALDARIRLGTPLPKGQRMAIRPYPADQEEYFVMHDGREALLRPILPEDEPNHHVFIAKLTSEDARFRFFGMVHELPHTEMARLTQIDYDREMAFIGEVILADGGRETLGVVRTIADPDNEKAEFAIVIRSDLKRSGLGKRLMQKMIDYCRSRGTKAIVGQVLKDNTRMLGFIEHLGFHPVRSIDGDIVEVELVLWEK